MSAKADALLQLARALDSARVILGNMAKENPETNAFCFRRWPINHEPLRADAKNALPRIEAAIAALRALAQQAEEERT